MPRQMSVPRKLLLLNIAIGIAFIALLGVFIKVKGEPIAFAEGERQGIEHQTALQDLLDAVAVYRLQMARTEEAKSRLVSTSPFSLDA